MGRASWAEMRLLCQSLLWCKSNELLTDSYTRCTGARLVWPCQDELRSWCSRSLTYFLVDVICVLFVIKFSGLCKIKVFSHVRCYILIVFDILKHLEVSLLIFMFRYQFVLLQKYYWSQLKTQQKRNSSKVVSETPSMQIIIELLSNSSRYPKVIVSVFFSLCYQLV